MSTNPNDDLYETRRELIQNGMEIGLMHSYSRVSGSATPESEERFADLTDRNTLALLAAAQQIDPEEFKKRVTLRRRRETAKRRLEAARKRRQPTKKRQAAVPDKPAPVNAAEAPPSPSPAPKTRIVRR